MTFTVTTCNTYTSSRLNTADRLKEYLHANPWVVDLLKAGRQPIFVITGVNWAWSDNDKAMQLQTVYVADTPFVQPLRIDVIGTVDMLGPRYFEAVKQEILARSSSSASASSAAASAAVSAASSAAASAAIRDARGAAGGASNVDSTSEEEGWEPMTGKSPPAPNTAAAAPPESEDEEDGGVGFFGSFNPKRNLAGMTPTSEQTARNGKRGAEAMAEEDSFSSSSSSRSSSSSSSDSSSDSDHSASDNGGIK